jgi:hypothetical protein
LFIIIIVLESFLSTIKMTSMSEAYVASQMPIEIVLDSLRFIPFAHDMLGALGSCRVLRDLILNTPALWAAIEMDRHADSRWSRLCVSRAADAPLSIHITGRWAYHLDELRFDYLLELMPKAQHLTFTWPQNRTLLSIWPILVVLDDSRLQSMVLRGWAWWPWSGPTHTNTQHFTRLDISSGFVSANATLPHLPSLRHLRLHMNEHPIALPDFLASSVNLEVVRINADLQSDQMSTIAANLRERTAAQMPCLRALEIEGSANYMELLLNLFPDPSCYFGIVISDTKHDGLVIYRKASTGLTKCTTILRRLQHFWQARTSQPRLPCGLVDASLSAREHIADDPVVQFGNRRSSHLDEHMSEPCLYFCVRTPIIEAADVFHDIQTLRVNIRGRSITRMAVDRPLFLSNLLPRLRTLVLVQAICQNEAASLGFERWLAERAEAGMPLMTLEARECDMALCSFGRGLAKDGLVRAFVV